MVVAILSLVLLIDGIFKSMQKYTLIASLIICSNLAIAQSGNDSTEWLTEVNKAHVISKSTGRPIFAFFTGSDWCVWCRKLQADVFAKPAFKEWANEEVVLLELDFPARKALPAHIVQQNQQLKSFFKIEGFPTIWLFCINEDSEKQNHFLISPYGSLGYPKEPVKGKEEVKFLADAKSIVGSKTCQ
jgi:thiol-disulfide isomerase/thioredoxin